MEKEIARLHDDVGLSYRNIGITLGNKLRKKPFDHKMISSRYIKYKKSILEEPKKRNKSQREILSEYEDNIIELQKNNLTPNP